MYLYFRNLSVEKSKEKEKAGKAAAAGSIKNPEATDFSETQDDIKVGNIINEKLRTRALSGPGVIFSHKTVSRIPESCIKNEENDLVSAKKCDQEQSRNSISSSERSTEAPELSRPNEMQSTQAGSKHSETRTVGSVGDTNITEAVSSDCERVTESQAPQSDKQTPSCSNTEVAVKSPALKPGTPSLFFFDQHTTALDVSLFSECELLEEVKKKFGCEHEDSKLNFC